MNAHGRLPLHSVARSAIRPVYSRPAHAAREGRRDQPSHAVLVRASHEVASAARFAVRLLSQPSAQYAACRHPVCAGSGIRSRRLRRVQAHRKSRVSDTESARRTAQPMHVQSLVSMCRCRSTAGLTKRWSELAKAFGVAQLVLVRFQISD